MPQKHLYLPKLITGANISEPVSDAVWEDKERKVVTDISDGIEIDEATLNKGVSSIPDIYARPLTFLGALRYDKHPMRKRMIQEWRGLLSLLALHTVKPDLGKLEITAVALNDEKFGRALKNLAPDSILLQQGVEYKWTDFLIIKFDDIPIGAFSPATLVYTSADYNNKLRELKGFSLIDEQGYLCPPGKTQGLDYVGKWLENFIKSFNRLAHTDESESKAHVYSGNINKLLDEWIREIKQELNVPVNVGIRADRVKVADEMPEYNIAFLPKYEIYQLLLTPLVKESKDGDGYKSDYSLLMSRNRSAQSGVAYKEVVIITTQLLNQNRKLWDDTTPKELDPDTNTLISKFFSKPFDSVINRINLKNDDSIWIRPELYFLTDTLLKSKTDDDILNGNESFLNAGSTEFILPFKKEILQFFSPVDIQEILKPKFRKTDDKVIFTFSLPLVDNQTIEIKKTYRNKLNGLQDGEGEILESEVPVLEIFPNYLGDFWCQYFMLCSNLESFYITPLNYAQETAVTRKEQLIETNNSREKAEIIRIAGYDSFPEAINIGSNSGNKRELGLILLNKDTSVSKPFNGKVIVGVDLGTSNTNIYRYTDGNARRWQFKFSKYVRSVLNSDPYAGKMDTYNKKTISKRDQITRAFFVPTKDQELPIPTVLRVFKAGVTKDILLDQFIYFPDQPQYPGNVETDIKWSEDITKMLAFIRSTVFLVLIDLLQDRVGNISFRCTYPKSYSDDKVASLKLTWTQILDGFIYKPNAGEAPNLEGKFIWAEKFNNDEDNTYIISTAHNGKLTLNTRPEFTTEGIAAGEYFSSDLIITDGVSNANKQDGAICIDVGGGTSDYSIWFDSQIKMDASVLLAGQQISKLLKNNSRVRDLLLTEAAADSLTDVKDDEQLFFSRLNFILRDNEKLISANLSNSSQSKDIAWLRRILAIEFGALAFYAAHLCLSLDEFLNFKFSERIKENSFKLHWGGNAAKFINWIDYGVHEEDGIASKFLNGIFGNTIYEKSIGNRAFRPIKLGQMQSPGHKNEASGGVAVMNDSHFDKELEQQNQDASFGFIEIADEVEFMGAGQSDGTNAMGGLTLGEQVTINNVEYQHYDVISKNQFFEGNESVFNQTSLRQLERFIYLVNQVGRVTGLFPVGSEISLSLDEKLAIKQRVKNRMAELAKEKIDKRVVESVFILEVKFMLEILSHKMR